MTFVIATAVAFGWLLVLAGVRQGHWLMVFGLVLARVFGSIGTRYFIEIGLLLAVAIGIDRILSNSLKGSPFAQRLPRWMPLAGGLVGGLMGLALGGNSTITIYGSFLGALVAGWVRGVGELRSMHPLYWVSEFARVLSLFVSAVWLIFRLT